MLIHQANYLPPDISHLINSELRSGERILWIGQPIASQFAWRSYGIVLFGISWTAFAIFWMAGASGFKIPDFRQGQDFFPLFGVPFVLAGFGLLSSPYWMFRKARRTAYVVTDRRAIIFDSGLFGTVTIRSFEPEQLKDIRRVQRPDGTGDLIFKRSRATDAEGGRQPADCGFLAIAGVREVEEMINRLTGAAKL
jgi:hypothetical protein